MSREDIWTEERRKKVFEMAQKGMSGAQIGRVLGVTRNSVIGQISRHRGKYDPVKKDRQTAKSAGSAFFSGATQPRRFSWESEA